MATVEALMTAEEFERRPDPGYPEELVRGRLVRLPFPDRREGYVCTNAAVLVGEHVERLALGRVMIGTGLVFERDPDTVRGADVAYYSFARLPRGPLPKGSGPEIPELVVEVRSTHDRWQDVQEKAVEYLKAGVVVVLVLDPERQTGHVFHADGPPTTLNEADELTLPGILEGFRVRLDRFFESGRVHEHATSRDPLRESRTDRARPKPRVTGQSATGACPPAP